MKMRKLLPLVLVAVGALFLLSGCDAMLDAIFPSNQIYVDVEVSKADFPVDWGAVYHLGASPGTVTLQLLDVNSAGVTTATETWTNVDLSYIHFPFVFTKLKDDTFQLIATYTSLFYGQHSISVFYDPSGIPLTSISMPYHNSGDATGHSVNLYMYF